MAQKKFGELDLKNAFLFAAALDEPETCRLILELILGQNIGRYHQAEMDLILKPGEKEGLLEHSVYCKNLPYKREKFKNS
ncbi:hypothetical protein [Candidatus Merdisoma sp. JLR.KK006]|uniref:hypothetical protein n=1 Tax=Candidatus Merdisoma sp. JLR.KK006 TaxID=3112626 RepID=UPI002FF2014B